ncbi:hypothetical protein [Streptomyces sp. NPDC023838]|uniref:hypothetical protein n=1 Tax=Streptomyces sp. NPDC023838 TaxID=3154325 RepID=UPI0033FB8D80
MTADTPEAAPQQSDDEKPEQPAESDESQDDAESGVDDQPQDAWAARRDLEDHTPRTMRYGARTRFTSGRVGGDNHGVSAGQIVGDVITGTKTEIYYQFGGAAHSSGEVPAAVLERIAAHFVAGEAHFATLAERLRTDRVLVISGPHFSGRRTAALMLLRRLGATPVRMLDRTTAPSALAQQLGGDGHVLCDLITERGRPLREADVLAARDRLAEKGGHLVITVDPLAALDGIQAAKWEPPAPVAVLQAHLRAAVDPETVEKLLTLPAVTEFLGRNHQLREAATYAKELVRYALGETGAQEIERFSQTALERQIQEWFEEDEASLHLRDKAFLVALAAFDGGPYALTAELSDLLYGLLQKTDNPGLMPRVPVFGTHMGKRLQVARAIPYEEEENTEWGPVTQLKAAFQDERAALILLREVWTGHPSARPALVDWLRRLAGDGRPLVRTRAAATAAVLARADLPSAMALVIEPWATSSGFRHRQVTVNALVLAHLIGLANVSRIIDSWCVSDDWKLSWVAIRAHGLIGPERPLETLVALRGAARRQHDRDEPQELLIAELAESVELLILSPADDQVLADLYRTLHDDRAVFDLALRGFLSACKRTEQDEPYGSPLVLDRYTRALQEGSPAAGHIAALWRAALRDPDHTRQALEVLRRWVLIAEHSPDTTEWALAALLPALTGSTSEYQRLDHLLRTMPGEDGAAPPLVASRLRTVLSPR